MYNDELYHYGVKGQKWGVRRYQNADGSLTDKGRRRSIRKLNTNNYLYEHATVLKNGTRYSRKTTNNTLDRGSKIITKLSKVKYDACKDIADKQASKVNEYIDKIGADKLKVVRSRKYGYDIVGAMGQSWYISWTGNRYVEKDK